jgi:SAM-dependent methyltransferase
MPAERLAYESDFFDCVIARDILHHTDIPLVLGEIARVSKPGATLVINEVYSHRTLDRIRRLRVVDRWLYSRLRDFVYQGRDPYITEDERKLNESDVRLISGRFASLDSEDYFGLLVGRVVPDKHALLSKLDRRLLMALGRLGRVFGSRVILAGRVLN